MQAEETLLCCVYRSEKKAGAYLYTAWRSDSDPLEELPQALLQVVAPLTEVMKLKLTPARKLANANAARVIKAIRDEGYYLQIPPLPGSRAKNSD